MRGLLMEVFDSHPYSRYIDQLLYCSVLALINNERSIKYKMCVKLFLWMEKLCADTLSFTQETFELAVKMLVQYISVAEEDPKKLQMLGCVVLHIASKLL